MDHARIAENFATAAMEIRVRGRVQGVGFRPAVWQMAHSLGLSGDVRNDSEGVLIRARGTPGALAAFIDRLRQSPPPLASLDSIEQRTLAANLPEGFRILESAGGEVRTQVAPDAAVCGDCAAEIADPSSRRFGYAFTTCTHCGPRLTIVTGIPYDRAETTMAPFALCPACAAEYGDPADRRFHAETTACPVCGPQARLIHLDGQAVDGADVDAVCGLLQKGEIVAIKGLGGYHLACDATIPEVVERLRTLKHRDTKPFALMARDVDVIRRYCALSELEEQCLESPQAPIVLLAASGRERLPDAVAPGLRTLGFMLPTTPLHLLVLRNLDRPLVMTSGNLSDEPQVTDDEALIERLGGIATYALTHDRAIANRVDDSVVREMDCRIRVLRRARGYAPAPIALPEGFSDAPDLIAFGAELKATFCLLKAGEAILSQHQGDLEDARTYGDYERNLSFYADLFGHRPEALAADLHPEYLSSKLAHRRALLGGLPLIEVQHHHAHVAACLAENGRPLHAAPVLGIALDGLGYGDDGSLWGGEFLLADYRGYERLATFKPVAMPGGAQAVRQPWRNLYAHLMAAIGWAELSMDFAGLDLYRELDGYPRAPLDRMLETGTQVPEASSCGRLFDAVAAAVGVAPRRQGYEGEAAARLEAIVDVDDQESSAYPFAISVLRPAGLTYIEPRPLWTAILADLKRETPRSVISARFHRGLARAIVAMVERLARGSARFDAVALTGGCFHNKVLLADTSRLLREGGFGVLTHARVPAGDGGIPLGQAAIAAAQLLGGSPCA